MTPLTQAIVDYIEQRKADKLDKFDKDTAKQLKNTADDERAMVEQQRRQQRFDEAQKFTVTAWLDSASHRAGQIDLVSHSAKYSHSDSKSSSILVQESHQRGDLLTTPALANITLDAARSAAALDVAKLLLLNDGQTRLMDCLQANDDSPLQPLASDPDQSQRWLAGLGQMLTPQAPQSHTLAKQVYFPLTPDTTRHYHLLAPLFASSLTQSLYERIQQAKFSEGAKIARKAHKESSPCPSDDIRYFNLASQNFGGGNPQNISWLNSQRNGKAYLLSCQPPRWQRRLNPPQTSQRFWQGYFRRVMRQINELKQFLSHQQDRNNVAIRRQRGRRVDRLVDDFIHHVAHYRQLAPGWSQQTDLTLAEQLLLDPLRQAQDDDFRHQYQQRDWCETIATDFAQRINEILKDKQLEMDDHSHQEWHKQLAKPLNQLQRTLEVW